MSRLLTRHVLTDVVVDGASSNIGEPKRLSIADSRSLPHVTRATPVIQAKYRKNKDENDNDNGQNGGRRVKSKPRPTRRRVVASARHTQLQANEITLLDMRGRHVVVVVGGNEATGRCVCVVQPSTGPLMQTPGLTRRDSGDGVFIRGKQQRSQEDSAST